MDLPVLYDCLGFAEKRVVKTKYTEVQKGLCHFCKKPLADKPIMDRSIKTYLFPKNFFKYPVHLHHDHNTGLTIGVVHAYCNAVLWQYYGE